MPERTDDERDAVPRLQPGTVAGGGVPTKALPPEWQRVVDDAKSTLKDQE